MASRATSQSPPRRARAPTITIDTSAVGAPAPMENNIPMHPLSNASPSLQGDTIQTTSSTLGTSPPSTSPGNFLSVPGGRSREGSFDSTQSETIAASDPGRKSSFGGDASADNDLVSDEEALRPDPGTEADFHVDDNKFAFTPGQLSKLIHPKNFAAFRALGGSRGLEKGLRTDLQAGLSVDEQSLDGNVTFEEAVMHGDKVVPKSVATAQPHEEHHQSTLNHESGKEGLFSDRKRIFKDNRLPARKTKNIFQLMWMAYNDKVLILLTIAALVSLAIGIPQSVSETGQAPQHPGENRNPLDPQESRGLEWIEGVAICVAIILVVVVGATNDWQKEQQFVKLNKKKEDRNIKVIRSGKTQELSVYDILVGDIVLLETGDMIPVDGIFLDGHNVKCDESSATGESDLLKKTPADEVFKAIENGQNVKRMDPFILSGGRVSEGFGRFVVTAVGVNSSYGKTMMSLREEGEVTPLQSKLNVLAEYIAKLGGAAALLYFVVAFIEFLVRITRGSEASYSAAEKGQAFLQIFILAVSIIVVAVPEGLPLAVTLALAFATTRMLKDNNLVRLLRSCETMGNATTVCSDKTGTLTQNKMTVVAGTLSTSSRFGDRHGTKDDTATGKQKGSAAAQRGDDDVSPQEFTSTLHSEVKTLLEQSIVMNTTAFEGEEDGVKTFIGSKTETALLLFARDFLGMGQVNVERSNTEVAQIFPFDSTRKCMAAVVKLPNGKFRMYSKGASEILLARCSRILDDPAAGVRSRTMSQDNREMLQHIISVYASRSLRTIALLYRDFDSWPPVGARRLEDDPSQIMFDDVHRDMTFLGVVGIQDPLRPSVIQAVADCKKAGVFVRMVTGDNVQTAKAIATECGIFTEGGEILEGPDFRKLSRDQLDKVLPRLQVLARSSPEDKRKLVKRLKELGETVAVTGDGTNDAPALKTADVGFSMGIAGTEVAKEASAIILMDDNFSSIVKALMWGRAVNDAVKKFLQFQITVNITAVITTFVSGVSSGSGESVLTAVQLLWVNLIMDTFAALALATDPPSRSILDRKPDRKSDSLITVTMWKMIIGQAIYQLVVVFVLYYKGNDILNYNDSLWEQASLGTLIFNTFVWMQIFNALNNRRLDNRFNILEGIHRNIFFIVIISIMIGGQILIIFVGGAALSVISNPTLRGDQWAISIVLGALTIPIGMVIRLVPDELVKRLVPGFLRRRAAPKLSVEDEEARYEWNPALEEVRDQLAWLKKVKGGRLNNLRFAVRHPREAGLLPPRPSSAMTRSRSSTGASLAQNTEDASVHLDPNRPITPLRASNEASRTSTPDPRSRSRNRRGRSRSNSAFGPGVVAAGIIAGSIGGWSPIERPQGASHEFPPSYHSRSGSSIGNIDEASNGKKDSNEGK